LNEAFEHVLNTITNQKIIAKENKGIEETALGEFYKTILSTKN
jgi:hypothetical protein